jgi:hypothetical protein
MKRHYATTLTVPAGAEIVIAIGGETFVHHAASPSVQIEIGERTSGPDIGAPSMSQHAQTVAEMGLKTRG